MAQEVEKNIKSHSARKNISDILYYVSEVSEPTDSTGRVWPTGVKLSESRQLLLLLSVN